MQEQLVNIRCTVLACRDAFRRTDVYKSRGGQGWVRGPLSSG